MIGTTTIFKNDEFFGGDVVLRTENFNSGYIGVEVTVIPHDVAAQPSGGGMLWELSIPLGDMSDNSEVLAEIKKDEYNTYGASETLDVIEAPEKYMDLEDFPKHMSESVTELLDHMEFNDYHEKFDLIIEWNGAKLRLDMHADLYQNLEAFINHAIEEDQQ